MENIRLRSLPGIKDALAPVPSAQDLALINSLYARQPLTAEDIHIRKARVAHNQHDRTFERFPKAMLERFAETLPGKSLLPGHDTSALPLGRWFEADTRTRTEEFPVISGGAKVAEIVPGMEPQKTRVTWLEAGFYFANDPGTELFRKCIDGGVYQDVSIGFSYDDIHCDVCRKSYWRSDCPHWAGQKLEDGVVVTLTYAGDPKLYEARETSIVYLGAQQHAELTKSLREGTLDPEALALTPWGTDYVQLKQYEALARERKTARKDFAAISSPVGEAAASLEADTSTTPPDAAAVAATGKEHDMEEIRKALGLPETADESQAVAAIQTLTEAKANAEAREPLAKIGETALKDLRDAILADETRLTGKDSTELMEITEMHQKGGNYDRLKALASEKREAVLAKFKPGISGDPTATGDSSAAPIPAADLRRLALAG